MSKNTLIEIPFEDWSKLRDLYINRKLESNSFNLIQNFIDWLNKDPSLKESIKIYSLNGDWSDGTFILCDHGCYIMPNTLADSQDRLLAALHCLYKKDVFMFYGSPLRIKPTIDKYITELGINKDSVNFHTVIWHHIELKKALEFQIDPPEGITLSPIREEDIDIVNRLWPHYHPGSELFVGRLIKFNQSIGAYDENGKLVAWCLLLPFGALGLLQVIDSHKRKGFGSLVVKAMAKINAEKGIETMAPVVKENAGSLAMFRSLGFQGIDKIFFCEF
ncbi:uncharacterized protein LOC129907697 [Episyrphus balteatus]|uniref:uncharacterized protein LOC129907697 n=1 Tax=Episyrphus balteatus TaxID=286459 RepID=UPI002485C35E|nr:uncharacterized protein LOC129907697 [Episyrphus balteatus]